VGDSARRTTPGLREVSVPAQLARRRWPSPPDPRLLDLWPGGRAHALPAGHLRLHGLARRRRRLPRTPLVTQVKRSGAG
jgi:hypothetical protein